MQFGKDLGYFAEHHVIERRHGGYSKLVQCGRNRYRMAVQVTQPRAAVGDVDSDRHIEPARFVVNWIEIWVRQQAVAFNRTHQHGARAILLGKTDLVERIRHTQRRRHAGPAQSSFPLTPNIGEPPIPAFAQGHLDRPPIGGRFYKHRVMQYLNIDTSFVHVLEAQLHIPQLARFLRVGKLAANPLRSPCELCS